MTDLVAKRAKYKGISDDRRDYLVKRAVDVVKRRFSYGVAVAINKKEFDALAPKRVRGFSHAYPYLCHMAIHALVFTAERHNDNSPFHFIFEAGQEHEAEARDFVKLFTLTPELKASYHYRSDSFIIKRMRFLCRPLICLRGKS